MIHRLLLDTSSLMYRAYFSVPLSVADRDGRAVNAVHGYLEYTTRLTVDLRPDEVVHVYDDDWRPAPRVALYAGYKGNRAADPEPLPPQFDLLREVLDAFGARQADAASWEADDAIGALCSAVGPGEGVRVDVVTGDRDLIQLVRDPVVRILFTLRGVTEMATYDEAGVLAKYGLPADRYIEFATLRGDPSDGLPGVPGVGEKTARALVLAYPSIDAMLAEAFGDAPPSRAPLKGSPGLRSRLRAAAGYLAVMKEVVPVRTDVEVRTWGGHEPDVDRLDELARSRNLRGPIRRLREISAVRS